MISLRAPKFWWQRPGAAAALLYPAGAIYGAVAARRLARGGYRASVPVICVGNPTLGGAGKTPAAIAIAKLLQEGGRRVFFLTRGYGGSAQGPLLVDLQKHDPREIGDEAPLLAAVAPTVVARDRADGARLAEQTGAEVIVMDDGFQNPSLEKTVSLLVIDGVQGLGNGLVFPAGPLRAPLDPQLSRAQAVILVGEGDAGEKATRLAAGAGLHLLRANIVPDGYASAAFAGKQVFAFAGIGAPEKFFRTLERAGAEVTARKAFGDHHRYSAKDADDLLQEAQTRGLTLVTTAKDRARMVGDPALQALHARAQALDVALVFEDSAKLKSLIGLAS